jgi:hypothetical protein
MMIYTRLLQQKTKHIPLIIVLYSLVCTNIHAQDKVIGPSPNAAKLVDMVLCR